MIESGEHLWMCLLYVDVNMVRAGVVGHPREWEWCGYRELTAFACQQLRLYLRRRRARKDIVGYRRWPNGFFHEKGLEYVPNLL